MGNLGFNSTVCCSICLCRGKGDTVVYFCPEQVISVEQESIAQNKISKLPYLTCNVAR